ncbi:thioredoxin family protein [Herminiimonas fonticola]|uniref:Thioredoxin n=1 Tax=Herminiimonas fonticola TaxID=303380 RepID=A0A4R6G3A9_9BURK|nr:thioredoxin family protein [Herminiimonas fonticola]RBA23435.1 Thioredoxin [Herminiimonas fonticola]TDN88310.1 thioredoxin [Herminiimonas fonticola]
MPSITLQPENQHQLAQRMKDDVWVVACLCAAWCDVCTSYRPGFDELSAQHPDKLFVWIDIEDSADLVGDFDVENFPTLLIQRGDDVMFYGTTIPDHRIAHRLIASHVDKTESELKLQTQSSIEHKEWQLERNLRKALIQG